MGAFLDEWLPRELKQTRDQWLALKARVLVLLLLASIVPFVPVIALLASVGILTSVAVWNMVFMLAGIMVGQLICLLFFRKTGYLSIAGFVYSLLSTSMVAVVIFYTGGWESPVKIFLLTLPVLIGMVVSPAMGAFFAILVLGFYTAIFYITENGYVFHQLVPPEWLVIVRAILWAFTLLSLVACLLLYDWSSKTMAAIVAEDKRALENEVLFDPVTGGYNEGVLFESLEDIFERQVESKAVFGILFIEVSKLNQITNSYGYEAGDIFLAGLGEQIRSNLPDRWLFGRYSSDGLILFSDDAEDEREFARKAAAITSLNGGKVKLDSRMTFRIELRFGRAVSSGVEYPDQLLDAARESLSGATMPALETVVI
jgi:diguanylate cyclase (GGDEF)-like protein